MKKEIKQALEKIMPTTVDDLPPYYTKGELILGRPHDLILNTPTMLGAYAALQQAILDAHPEVKIASVEMRLPLTEQQLQDNLRALQAMYKRYAEQYELYTDGKGHSSYSAKEFAEKTGLPYSEEEQP